MKRVSSFVPAFLVSIALLALVISSALAGPGSGGRSYQYRVGAGSTAAYSSSPTPLIVSGSFTPLYNPEPVLYAYYAAPARAPGAGGEEESETFVAKPAVANIEITVPAGAEVWIDGLPTRQTGAARSFITPPLERGKTYGYDLHVRWTAPDGLVVDVTRPIQVQAGRQTMVGFTK